VIALLLAAAVQAAPCPSFERDGRQDGNCRPIRIIEAPAPLPVAGLLLAFGFSRKLRQRIRSMPTTKNNE
jgi:hypothetical protein